MRDDEPEPLDHPAGYDLDEPMYRDWCFWLMLVLGGFPIVSALGEPFRLFFLDGVFVASINLLVCIAVVALRNVLRKSSLKSRPDRPASDAATPGWFRDPSGRADFRRWDGGWEARVVVNGVRKIDRVGMELLAGSSALASSQPAATGPADSASTLLPPPPPHPG